jgi:hypothetical protein
MPPSALDERSIGRLKAILGEFPGDSPVVLHLAPGKVLRLAQDFAVDADRVVGHLRVAFGHDAVLAAG